MNFFFSSIIFFKNLSFQVGKRKIKNKNKLNLFNNDLDLCLIQHKDKHSDRSWRYIYFDWV